MPTRVSKRQAAKGPVKVKSSTIGAIKKTGMTKALGNITPAQRKNAAYMTGLKRMYGAARVNKALAPKNMSVPVGGVMGTKRAQVMAGPVKSTVKKKVIKRNAAGKVVNRQSFADLTPAQQKAVTAKMKADRSKTSRTIGKVVGAVAAPFGPVGAAAAIYGTRDVRKRKKK